MHPLTLKFTGNLERAFLDEYSGKHLKYARAILLFGFFLYAIFGILDGVLVPEIKNKVFFIRYVIVCPILLVSYLISYSGHFRKVMQVWLSFCDLLAAAGIIAMIVMADVPGRYLYYAGLILCIIYAHTILRFLFATTTSWAIILIYEVIVVHDGTTPVPILVNNTFFLLATNIIGMFASYFIEFYVRRDFLQKQVIAERTEELEEKNEELLGKNRELFQSREELLQSMRRAELIFSALSEALPGTVLEDKYQLEEKIGSGGFGTVYRAKQLHLNRAVAVKVFRPVVGGDALGSLERFRREGISACKVNHPNAVTVLDFGITASSVAYLVMELLEGKSLADELAQSGTLLPRRGGEILVPVCAVLSEVHAKGVVHRDIKPSNIFLHQTGAGEVVKVVDFGIAKLITDSSDSGIQSLTEAGQFIGTPAYIAPERLNNLPYNGRADVYSLGVMLYEMLCGRLPFPTEGKGVMEIAVMHLTSTPQPLRRINPNVPEEIEGVVLRAMAKDPEQRPTAKGLAREYVEALARCAVSWEISKPGLSPDAPRMIPGEPDIRRTELVNPVRPGAQQTVLESDSAGNRRTSADKVANKEDNLTR